MVDHRNVVLRRRVKELRRYLLWRYGPELPEHDDAAIDDLAVFVRHLVDMPNGEQLARNTVQLFAPWMPPAKTDAMIATAQDLSIGRIMFDVHELGVRIGLTDEVREKLGIRLIEACDVTPAQRRAINKEKRRVKAQQDRARKREEKAAALSPRAATIVDAIATANDWQSVAEIVEAVRDRPPFLFGGRLMPKESARKAVFRECRKLADSGYLQSRSVNVAHAPTFFVFAMNFDRSRVFVPGTSEVMKKAVGA